MDTTLDLDPRNMILLLAFSLPCHMILTKSLHLSEPVSPPILYAFWGTECASAGVCGYHCEAQFYLEHLEVTAIRNNEQ